MGSGGKTSSQPTTQTVNQNTLPEWMRPYAERMLGQAEALTSLNQNPYQPYGGQQVAGFNPLQQQAFQNIYGMTPSSQLGQATGLAGLAGTQSFTGDNVSQFMSPYMQEVVKQQQLGVVEDYSKSLPQLASVTTQAGGLGGTRQALLQSEAQRGLQSQLANIRASGTQAAFQNAQQQYNQQIQDRLAASGLLGQLGMMTSQQQRDIAQTQLGAGQQIQGLEQKGLDALLSQFREQQQYPYQQLGFFSNLLRGLPTVQQSSAVYSQQPNTMGQVAGLAGGIGSLMGN